MPTETASPAADTGSGGRASDVGLLAIVGALTLIVLVLTAYDQIHDTNFYSLFEATSLLAGDHPYRDFYEWGMPLQVVLSAGAQRLAHNRLIAEFLLQWSSIVIGMLIAYRIALRLSTSVWAVIVTMPLTFAILAATPTFHYPKLLLYPLAMWFAWRYLERPSVRGGAVLGFVTAIAFLFRHDHGVYVGGLSVLTFGLSRVVVPASRQAGAMTRECLAYTAVTAAVIAPWLVVVHRSEGVAEYVRARMFLYSEWSAHRSPYVSLLHLNPVRILNPEVPPIRPAPVSFKWVAGTELKTREHLERRLRLSRRSGPDANGRWNYVVQNPYDPALLELEPLITESDGLDWSLLRRLLWHVPTHEQGQTWIMQMALLVPLLVLLWDGIDLRARRARGTAVPGNLYAAILLAIFLSLIDSRLFREPSYVVTVTPLTAALAARLLASKDRGADWRTMPGVMKLWTIARWTAIAVLLLVTGFATYGFARDSDIFRPVLLSRMVRPAFTQLFASPPIDGYQPADDARRISSEQWSDIDVDKKMAVLIRYIHDCTRAGDRVLVTGSTPYQVGYYAERPIAGGHVFWHHEWRSDPAHAAQSLALLETQSVPYAFSTHDPVLDDFKKYPAIRNYLVTHYVALEGTRGRLLVDQRRRPTATFGALGFPCFK